MEDKWELLAVCIFIIIVAIIETCPLWKSLWAKHKPEALKRKQADRVARDMKEKASAISHINGLLEAVAWNENKTKLIIKIIDRIGFSEMEKNMFLARKYHAGFAVPEKENTKKLYLKDWVEVMADNRELSNPEYHLCCDMATKYECSTDVIKEIMDEIGITLTSTMKPTNNTRTAKNDSLNSQNVAVPDLSTTNTVIWMAHCINLPFLSQAKNMEINMSIMSLLKNYENAVKTGDDEKTVEIFNEIQHNMREKFGDQINNPMVKAYMHDFKICALSKDLLDVYKMVIEGKKDEDVLSGKGSIRRILKYSIELGLPAKTLDALVEYFINNVWFDNMQEQVEWHKLALECMMVSGNGEMGDKILGLLQDEGGIGDDEKEELLDHAREFRNQIDVSWM